MSSKWPELLCHVIIHMSGPDGPLSRHTSSPAPCPVLAVSPCSMGSYLSFKVWLKGCLLWEALPACSSPSEWMALWPRLAPVPLDLMQPFPPGPSPPEHCTLSMSRLAPTGLHPPVGLITSWVLGRPQIPLEESASPRGDFGEYLFSIHSVLSGYKQIPSPQSLGVAQPSTKGGTAWLPGWRHCHGNQKGVQSRCVFWCHPSLLS